MDKFESPIEPALHTLIDQFWETFPPTWSRIRAHVQAVAAEQFDVTIEQFHVLRHIRKGAVSVSDLAEVKQTSRSAISQAVEVLVGKGLVARQQEVVDRRCVRLALTPAGNELLNAVFKANRAWMLEKLKVFPPAQIGSAVQALQLLAKAFERE